MPTIGKNKSVGPCLKRREASRSAFTRMERRPLRPLEHQIEQGPEGKSGLVDEEDKVEPIGSFNRHSSEGQHEEEANNGDGSIANTTTVNVKGGENLETMEVENLKASMDIC